MNFGNKIKFFNYRPLVSAFMFMMLGIIFVVGLIVKTPFFYALSIITLIVVVSNIILKSVFAKNKAIIKIFIVFISFILGFMFTAMNVIKLNNQEEIKGEYVVEGSISTLASSAKSGLWVVNLKNVLLISDNRVVKVDGEVRVYIDEGDGRVRDFVLGERVKGVLSLKKSEYFSQGNTNFYLANNKIALIGFCDEDEIESVGKTESNLFDAIKNKTKVTLDKFLSKEYSGLAYTMLFGDKANLDDNIYESYSASGISHLLAVSGLHVGFLVAMLGFILSIFKAKDKTKFIIIALTTFLYAFMCGFSVSVTRAFLMTVILLFSKLRKKKYDSLSAVSMAGIIILIYNPLYLFDVGFILSFGAVISIILLNGLLSDLFNKIFNQKLASALTVSMSAGVGTFLPIMLFFNKISLLSFITNIIVVPIASLAFMIMLPLMFVAMIIEPLGVFIYMFEFLMKIVTWISSLTGSISLVGLNSCFVTGFGLSLLLAILLNSDYVLISNKTKKIVSIMFFVLSVSILSLSFIC